MWASNNSEGSNIAHLAGEDAMGAIMTERKINLRSPAASGRIAMAVYHAVFNAEHEVGPACYWAEWWATDGGDLEGVPDGSPPDDADPDYIPEWQAN